MNKDEIFAEVRRRALRGGDSPGACLWYAKHGIDVLAEHGIEACFQAGSASWRREAGDGENSGFGYVWERPDSWRAKPRDIITAMVTERLLEVHVWLGVVQTQELIDFASGLFPAQAKRLLGWDWAWALPPDYLWCRADEQPLDAMYRPSVSATIYAASLLEIQRHARKKSGFLVL